MIDVTFGNADHYLKRFTGLSHEKPDPGGSK